MIRGMLHQGFLSSSQLYVMWPHTAAHIADFFSALDEVLAGVSRIHAAGDLQKEAGPQVVGGGFARLA